ncbi:hypothetical protein GRI75_02360 [Altererythrobacter soli]|uniref:TVP38/TMEM64 family membrane protein n=1 Tax=Croceibacterium soli TaxID=1739690 RepID=A0A6I4US62_9SPHN|nr:VTT domain-containing protein [Croceibacterium soli]MXP40489.1 hypothetical protein [Croceibacterium soli]
MVLEFLSPLNALLQSELLLALALFGLTATLIAFCVPGMIVPLSMSSGALLGGWQGVLVVSAGALLGSQALFLVTRHLMQHRVKNRFGSRIAKFETHLEKGGFLYVLGLRLVGAPHFVVTAGCALSPLRTAPFVAATLIGFLPVIALTSAAGSAF